MVDDVLMHKAAIIERCLKRVREEFAAVGGDLTKDITHQDSIILNLQRSCEASIDLAMHLVHKHRLGLPEDSREAFTLLHKAGILTAATGTAMASMVGFRNIAVHEYEALNLEIVAAIIKEHLDDFTTLVNDAIAQERQSTEKLR